ncbi:PEP-utilizing enzyme [Microbacterium sp. STN6]|uniref:PEP/pyruvate-binding domain-containing protein n=1 Tax=Microbacterium sp. STN6 TaxID=2995588 RepID=UPI002260E268|nr:PEP/pyruvate-binding domain-containing protein [Microbacterium sp. STN6]MCX7521931.1 PEP-utilizing enzyme [Microbacterium sp. STN6]
MTISSPRDEREPDAAGGPADYVVSLAGTGIFGRRTGTSPDALDVRIGRKAAGLARLARARIAVPESLVLTTEAYLAAGAAQTRSAGIPVEVDAAILAIARHFGDVPLAVRSSAVDEDRPTASYAGLYESVLGVRGEAQLRQAVLVCWASASAARVRRYVSSDMLSGARMAVLVQRQLTPDVAGVAFTADPLSGDRSVTVVSAVPGLGDRLADGSVTPDQWRVSNGSAVAERATLQALTAEQALAVAELARRIETVAGAPQDIEWAMDAGRLVILQTRPITALPQRPVDEPCDGVWLKELDRYAEPMTALGASVATVVVGRGLTSVFSRYGGLVERVDCRSVGGEIYLRMMPVGGREQGAPPPWWLLSILTRVVPDLRHRMRRARRNASPSAIAQSIERWRDTQRGALRSEIEAVQAVRIDLLDDTALAAHLGSVRDLFERAMALHFSLSVPAVLPLYVFTRMCRRLLGWDDARALRMLAGVSPATSEPARTIAPLAARLREYPDATQAIRAGGDIASALSAVSVDLARAYDKWCKRYACSCLSDDPGSATLAERPEVLRELILMDAGAVTRRLDAVRREALAVIEEVRGQLMRRGPRIRRAFEASLAQALTAYGLREDVAYWTGSRCGGLLRDAALAAGRRLAAAGRLDRSVDAVNLDIDTLIRALAGGGGDVRRAVATALAERAWVRRRPGPAVLGGGISPVPDLRGIPRRARTVNEAMQWVRSASRTAAAPVDGQQHALEGIPGSAGRVIGPARVIHGEADFGALRHGDVIVAATTDPAWSVLFAIAAGLVTDIGGVLSHAAIVAREHGIPAVLGTSLATSVLADGDILSVDGTLGRVTVTKRSGTAAASRLALRQQSSSQQSASQQKETS